MKTAELLAYLGSLDVRLWLDGERLRYSAPQGILTPALLAELAQQKQEICSFLRKAQNAVIDTKAVVASLPRNGHLPLSFSQQRLWFIDQLTPANAAYNVPSVIRLSGHLNVPALKQAISEIVRRHEVLRTTFTIVDRQPAQVVAPTFDVPLPTIDLQRLDDSQQEICTYKLAAQHAAVPFDLSRGPLLRISLLRMSDQEHILLVVMHHIVSDGWSMGLLVREIAVLYESFSQGKSSPLPELAIQYADFARWQRKWLSGPRLEKQLEYWKQRLAEAPILTSPTDRPRPSVQTFAGASYSHVLSESLCASLRDLSKQTGATLFMTMLAGFHAMLHRYTQQATILTGSPVANRTRAEAEPLIGLFINTLVMRSDFADDPSFLTHLGRLRRHALAAYAHQDLPFELLVDELQLARDLSHNPLYQVMFSWDDPAWSKLSLAGLEVNAVVVENQTSQLDLTVLVSEIEGGRLRCAVQYNTALFDAGSVRRLFTYYEELLNSAAQKPWQRISRLRLERNKTNEVYQAGTTLVELFERQVERDAAAVAVVSGGREVSYRELNERANRVARQLRMLGVEAEGRVGLLLDRDVEMVVGVLGIVKAGAAYVPMDPTYPQARLEYMLKDAAVSVVVTVERWQRLATEMIADAGTVLCLDEAGVEEGSAENPEITTESENLACILYTSSSTGQPQGVMNTHFDICNRLRWMQETCQLTVADRILQTTPVNSDVSVWEIFWPLLNGARLVMAESERHQDPAYLRRIIEQEQITIVHFVPVMLKRFLAESGVERCRSLQKVLCSGEPSLESQEELFARAGAEVHKLYGPAEAAIDVTCESSEQKSTPKVVPIGKPIANTQIYLLDQNYQPVPVGVAGELHIGGVGLARGYYGQPALTAEKFVANPFSSKPGARLYKTGDIARYLADGTIEFAGRVDHQVKLRGFRIELGEIETQLCEQRGVKTAVVIPREDETGHKRLVAYIVPTNNSPVSLNELRRGLEQKLPDYMIPAAFVVLPKLPHHPNGKIDRRALPAPDQMNVSSQKEYEAPRTEVETTLAEIWKQVLGLEQIGIHDNFFELGGDSILSIQIVARANQAGLKVSPDFIFTHQSIAKLSEVAVPSVASASASQEVATSALPLTPIQHNFFEQRLANPHHFNQFVLLEVRRPLEVERLQRVVEQLLLHHDALRLRFKRDEASGVWLQRYAGAEAAKEVCVELIDLSEVITDEQASLLETKAARLQSSLNLEDGPLMRVALIELGPNEQRLLIVIHHLAVDGVSWRILLDDLERGIDQKAGGEAISWGAKTTSYGRWSERLTEYAQLPAVKDELPFWSEVVRKTVELPLPFDFPDSVERTRRFTRSVVQHLDPDETRALLQEVPAAYRTQINDALLTALAKAIGKWTGERQVIVEVEGHGRVEIYDDLDLSRTVGWFTSLYPVVLDLEGCDSPGDALKQTKEQLRRIPGAGIGYGMLRYLSNDPAVRKQLSGGGPVELSFNYLGQLDHVLDTDSLFAPAREIAGPPQSESGRQRYALEVAAAILQGKLEVRFIYNEQLHAAETIQRVLDDYMNALRELVTHCQSPEAGGFTSSDFPLVNLNQNELDLAFNEIDFG